MLAKTLPRTVHLVGHNVQNPGRVRAVSVLKLSQQSDFLSNFNISTLLPHPKHHALIYVASLHPQQLSLRHVHSNGYTEHVALLMQVVLLLLMLLTLS